MFSLVKALHLEEEMLSLKLCTLTHQHQQQMVPLAHRL